MIIVCLLILSSLITTIRGQDCVRAEPPDCSRAAKSRYRTHDGSCNNINSGHPVMERAIWGRAYSCYKRFLGATYADYWGDELPKAKDGSELPNPRVISNKFYKQDGSNPSKVHSQQIPNFGQILADEVTYAGGVLNFLGQPTPDPCCDYSKKKSNTPESPKCAVIDVPKNDEFYSKFDVTCLGFTRSDPCATCDFTTQRVPITMRTPFMDFGNLYSNSKNDSDVIRTFKNGLLRLTSDYATLPRLGKDETSDCGARFRKYYPDEKDIDCYQSGDTYSNNNGQKLSLIIVFAREHNRLAIALKRQNPTWSDEHLFEEARKIVGAQMEIIAFNEWLPAVIGPGLMSAYNLDILKSGYTTYNPNLDPSMTIEFSSAAFRAFGHSVVSGDTYRIFANGTKIYTPLKDNFHHLIRIGEDFDAWNRGTINEPMETADHQMADVFRLYGEKTAKNWKPYGNDIAAVDIQRGRDHGVATYTSFFEMCFGAKTNSFDDLNDRMPPDTIRTLEKLFNDVNDIDLYIGGTAETPMDGALVGPTLGCVIGHQFNRIKFGDRYYFEHGNQCGSFTSSQLSTLRKETLASIICRNTISFKKIQKQVMYLPNSVSNSLVDCSSLSVLDIKAFEGKPQQKRDEVY